MSDDEAGNQPKKAAPIGPAIPKAVPKATTGVFVSSYINKNDTGKKVAPKVVARRRPGAAAAAAAKTPAVAPAAAPAAPPAEDGALPTPAATQETAPQEPAQPVPQPEVVSQPSTAAVSQASPAPLASPPPTAEAQSHASPKRKRTEENTQGQDTLPVAFSQASTAEETQSPPSPKRVRIEENTEDRAPNPTPAASQISSAPGPAIPKAVPKAPTGIFVSSYINKNDTGKKVAPKAVARRRPSAAAAVPAKSAVAPTPPATIRPAEEELEPARSPKRTRTEPGTAESEAPPNTASPAITPISAPSDEPPVAQDHHPETQTTAVASAGLHTPPATQIPVDPAIEQPQGQPSQTVGAPASVVPDSTHPTGTAATTTAPWSAVNHPRVALDGILDPNRRKTPLPELRLKRRAAAAAAKAAEAAEAAAAAASASAQAEVEGDAAEGSGVAEDQNAGTSGKSREWVPTAPPKKAKPKAPRKPRKDAGKKRKKADATVQDGGNDVENNVQGEAENETEGAAGPSQVRPPKPKPKRVTKKKRSATATTEGAEGDGEGQAPAARPRGRPRQEREPTPEDAEHQQIDTETTFMQSLTTNIRVGRLSEREKKMRTINWEEVKQRRKEEAEAAIANRGNTRRQVDEQLAKAHEERQALLNQQNIASSTRVDANGNIVLVQPNLNRDEEADREIELMEEVEEDDLTKRVTTKSFMRENKRFPEDLMLPGQGVRWTLEKTEQFYDTLRMFGTNFQTISHMFPGSTRRSMKLKFNREERDNPERVKAALAGEHTSSSTNWSTYLDMSGKKDEEFVDPQAIERELAEQREQMLGEINEAKAQREEEKRQRRLAGIPESEDEAVDPVTGKKPKRKRGERRAATFVPEEGVEILAAEEDSE